MNLTEFGSAVRKARIDARVTLQQMADDLKVTPAFLSGMEVGRKRIPEEWVSAIRGYFLERGIDLADLQKLADVANKSVPLDGLKPRHQLMMVAGFARASMSAEQLEKFSALLQEVEEGE